LVDKFDYLKPNKINIHIRDSLRILKTILISLERNPREFIPLSNVLIVEGHKIEAQLAILQKMIKEELIKINDTYMMELTEEGRRELNKEVKQTKLTKYPF
jgi:Mn-dependent DtxR family transcriptional regulator